MGDATTDAATGESRYGEGTAGRQTQGHPDADRARAAGIERPADRGAVWGTAEESRGTTEIVCRGAAYSRNHRDSAAPAHGTPPARYREIHDHGSNGRPCRDAAHLPRRRFWAG